MAPLNSLLMYPERFHRVTGSLFMYLFMDKFNIQYNEMIKCCHVQLKVHVVAVLELLILTHDLKQIFRVVNVLIAIFFLSTSRTCHPCWLKIYNSDGASQGVYPL